MRNYRRMATARQVKGVHQTDGEGQIAYLTRGKMFAQRLVNLIFRMAGGNVGDRLGPSQRRAFGRSKVGAYPPARKGIQFALRHAAFAQRLAMFLKTKGAAVDLRDA